MATTNGKIKIYRHPDRNRPANLKPYVPQYQLMGVEPEEYTSPTSPAYIGKVTRPAPLPKDNPRAPRSPIAYAETVPLPVVGRGKGPLPNVGNNMEQTWSGVDGELVDDMQLDPNHPMIDNNEEVSPLSPDETHLMQMVDETLNDDGTIRADTLSDLEVEEPLGKSPKTFLTEDELQSALKEEYLSAVLKNLEEGEYVLMVGENAVCSGPMEDIQHQARGLVFGEHPLCGGNPMPLDDIIILKRVQVKIGLFLEE